MTTPAPPKPNDEQIPDELASHPRYEVTGFLGKGGMGSVFKATHRVMNRTVAIKAIRPSVLSDPTVAERFRREIRVTARISHPNVVAAFDAEQVGAFLVLAMEYVEGESLDRVVRKGLPPIPAVAVWLAQAASGLGHAHELGIIHRDIKPQNLMVTPAGRLKILDFGLAVLGAGYVAPDDPENRSLTETDMIMGTPDYLSPEQVQGSREVDHRADLYSLGCTAYFLLIGRPPFSKGTVWSKLRQHLDAEPTPVHEIRPEVPVELSEAVSKLLAKAPEHRFQRADVLAEEFSRFAGAGGVTVAVPGVTS